MNTRYIVTLLFLLCVWVLSVSCRAGVKECGRKPADVVFVLDSSGSIWDPDFRRQLRFARDLLKAFDIAPDRTRVGLITFSNWALKQFDLNTYKNKRSMLKHIKNIQHIKGDTNTAAALRLLREDCFSDANGAREGVPRIGIVLTDGLSNRPDLTAKEALLVRKAGIQLFAVGIGPNVELTELSRIAYDEHFVFTVAGFHALYRIKNELAIKACEATAPPPTEPVLVDEACGRNSMADIVFATSPSSGMDDTDKALIFFKNISAGLNIADDKVHVGIVPRHCSHIPTMSLDTLQDKELAVSTIRQLEDEDGEAANPSHVLHYMRTVSFQPDHGARERAQKISVLIVDDKIPDERAAVDEANKMASEHNAQLFVVGVGKSASPAQMVKLATTSDRHFFHVSHYNELHTLVHRMQKSICPVADS